MNKIWVTLGVVLGFVVVLTLGLTIGLTVKNKGSHQVSIVKVELGKPKEETPSDSQVAGTAKTAEPAAPSVPAVPEAAPAPETPKLVPEADSTATTPLPGTPAQPADVSVTPEAPLPAPEEPPQDMAEGAKQPPSEGEIKTPEPEQIQKDLPSDPQPPVQTTEVVDEQGHPAAPGVKEPPVVPDVKEAVRPSVEFHPDLKIYTLDNDVAKVNDATKLELNLSEDKDCYTYTFKPSVECIEVRFRNFRVWVHDNNAHGANYPKELFYSASQHTVTVTINDAWMFTYDVERGYPRMLHSNIRGRPLFMEPPAKRLFRYEEEVAPDLPHSNIRSGTEVAGLDDVKVTTCRNTRGGEVNNQNDFDVYKDGDKFTWYLENGVKCIKFQFRDDVVWTHNIGEHKTLYPKRFEFNQKIYSLYVFFNDDWYYVYWYLSGRWQLNFKKVLTKPGSLIPLLKSVFNIDISVSPSLLLYFSNMSIKTIRFLLAFYPSVDAGFKGVIEKLYNSPLYYESFSSMTSDPDKLPKVLEFLKGTSLKIDETKLNGLVTNPSLLIHLVEELKTAGFAIHVLLKKLLLNPEKLKVLLGKMRELGYLLNETEISSLAKNKDIITYLKVDPKTLPVAA